MDPAQLAAWVGAGTGIAALVVSVASARYSRPSLNLARQVVHRADKPSFVWPARKNRVWSIDVEKAWADPDPN